MPYCTLADLERIMPPDTLRQLAADDPQASAPDPAIIEAALAHADARINAAAATGRLVIPNPPPPVIREIAAGLARGWLYARRPEGMDYPEAIRRQSDAHDKLLAEIAAGRLTFGMPSSLASVSTGSPRVFGRSNTSGY